MEIVIIRDQIRASQEEKEWFSDRFNNTLQLFMKLKANPKNFLKEAISHQIDTEIFNDGGGFRLTEGEKVSFYKCCSNIIYEDYLDDIEEACRLKVPFIKPNKYRKITAVEEVALGFLQECFLWQYMDGVSDTLVYLKPYPESFNYQINPRILGRENEETMYLAMNVSHAFLMSILNDKELGEAYFKKGSIDILNPITRERLKELFTERLIYTSDGKEVKPTEEKLESYLEVMEKLPKTMWKFILLEYPEAYYIKGCNGEPFKLEYPEPVNINDLLLQELGYINY